MTNADQITELLTCAAAELPLWSPCPERDALTADLELVTASLPILCHEELRLLAMQDQGQSMHVAVADMAYVLRLWGGSR